MKDSTFTFSTQPQLSVLVITRQAPHSLRDRSSRLVGKVDDRLDAISELHQAINQKFNDAAIVIAFPQRDIHFDSGKPLEIRLTRERRRESEPP